MKLTLDEPHLCGGTSGVHGGWRYVAGLSKEEEVWSHVREGGRRDEPGMNKEVAPGKECSAEVSRKGVQKMHRQVCSLSPATLSYLGREVGKAGRVLVVILDRRFLI